MKKKKKINKEDFAGDVSLLTGLYWIRGQMGFDYCDKERDEFIKKWSRYEKL